MKPSSEKPGGTKKNRTKRTQSKRRQSTTKVLVLALAARMRKAGTRPPVKPIARMKITGNAIKGNSFSAALYCGLVGDMADKAVDDMERAIEQNDEAALQKAMEDFDAAWNDGHSHGCYFTYV